MTISEMHIAVEQGLQRAGSYDFSDILPEEMDLQINRSIETFVKTRFDISLADPLGFEQTQKRLDDLRTLLKVFPYTTQVSTLQGVEDVSSVIYTGATNKRIMELPGDYWFYLRMNATVHPDVTCVDDEENYNGPVIESPVRLVRNNQVSFHLNHPWQTTSPESPLATIRTEDIEGSLYEVVIVFTDGVFDTPKFELEYLKAPAVVKYDYNNGGTLNVDCDLPDHTHTEIVDITVQHLSAIIQSSNYQQHTSERMQQE